MSNKFLRSFIYYLLAVVFLAFTLFTKSQSNPVSPQFPHSPRVASTAGRVGATHPSADMTRESGAGINSRKGQATCGSGRN